jgi:two-component system chemotaxis sensor kinase CheA
VQNTPGEGSAFIISLPLTLAVMDGMAVLAGKEQYIIPIGNILETLRPEPHQVQKVVNNSQVLNIRGELIPLLHLGRIFQIANAEENASNALVVIVYTGREKYGLIIDELVGQQQVVIKSLEANTKHVNGIAGATILGDGNVSLILDMSELFRLNASLSPVQSINSPQNEAA